MSASPLTSDTRLTVDIARHAYPTPGGDDLQVLDGVRFDLEPHTFVSLLGPSGCGKTTLLRMLAGLVAPTEGTVEIDGRAVEGPPEQVAMVFQEANLFPWRSALANVEFGLEVAGIPRGQRRARSRDALALVGLSSFEQSLPHQLSGGMKQRVGIARALTMDKPILLMDEPFGALDAQTRETMQDELVRIWEELRATVVFVTHSIQEAVYLSDRVLVMSARPGRVLADVPIGLARPRGGEGLEVRTSAEATAYVRELGGLLRPEVEAAGAL